MKRVSTFFLALVMAAVLCLAGPATALAAQGTQGGTTRVFYTEKNDYEAWFTVYYNGEEEFYPLTELYDNDIRDYSTRYTVQCNPNGKIDTVTVEANLPGQSAPMVMQIAPTHDETNQWGRNKETGQEYFEFSHAPSFEYQNIPGIPNGTQFDWENIELQWMFPLYYYGNQPYGTADGTLMFIMSGNLKLKDSEDYYHLNICLGTHSNVKDITDGYYEDVPSLAEGEYTGTGSATVQTPFGQFTARPGSATASIETYGSRSHLHLTFRMKTIAYDGYLDMKSWNRRTGEATYEGYGSWEWNGVRYYDLPWVAKTTPDGKVALHMEYEEGNNLGPVDTMDLELALAKK